MLRTLDLSKAAVFKDAGLTEEVYPTPNRVEIVIRAHFSSRAEKS